MSNLITDTQKTYKGWDIYEVLPKGWRIDKSCGSPLHGYDFCTNGISILNGGKRALVRSIRTGTPRIEFVEPPKEVKPIEVLLDNQSYTFPAKAVNVLARKKFQEKLLKEIIFDFMVCDIEGWDKKEYIRELKALINSIDISAKNKKQDNLTFNLFSILNHRP